MGQVVHWSDARDAHASYDEICAYASLDSRVTQV